MLFWEGKALLRKKMQKIAIYILASIALLAVIGAIYVNSLFQPVEPLLSEEKIQVEIPKGSNPSEIGTILKDNQLIKSELIFQLYVKTSGNDVALKAGKFELSKGMDLKEVTNELVNGEAIIDTVKFTIPEGYTVKQIAARLAEQGLVDEERFLQLAKEGNFDYDFIKQIPNDKNMGYKLEGYLFPETYEVIKGATEEEIIDKMLAQFEKEWKKEWEATAKEQGMTLHELVTLASIIEREVVVDEERPLVAGVFYNRLDDSWNLQSCATVQFILGKQKENLTYDDLEIDNPYNTYVYQGLPPGPIGSPGRSSLEAAVYPTEHDYYFFVTKKDNSGEHYFAKTYEEHLKNDANSRGSW